MVNFTLDNELVPYAGELPQRFNRPPTYDLTQNGLLADKLIRAARVLFQIPKGSITYSGYVYDKLDGRLKFRVRHKGRVVRTVVFNHVGYGGVLYMDVETERVQEALRFDVLGSLSDGMLRTEVLSISCYERGGGLATSSSAEQ